MVMMLLFVTVAFLLLLVTAAEEPKNGANRQTTHEAEGNHGKHAHWFVLRDDLAHTAILLRFHEAFRQRGFHFFAGLDRLDHVNSIDLVLNFSVGTRIVDCDRFIRSELVGEWLSLACVLVDWCRLLLSDDDSREGE